MPPETVKTSYSKRLADRAAGADSSAALIPPPRRRPWFVVAGLLVVLGTTAALVQWMRTTMPEEGGELQRFQRSVSALGCRGTIKVWAPADVGNVAVTVAARELHMLERAVDLSDSSSELSQLNRMASVVPFECSRRLWRLLQAARDAHAVTNGAFDVSTGPLSDLWRLERTPTGAEPTHEEVVETRKLTGMGRVVFDDPTRSVYFTVEGLRLDLWGLARGHGLDMAAAKLAACGVERGMIELGDRLCCLPKPPPEENNYRVALPHPFARDRIISDLRLLDTALARQGLMTSDAAASKRLPRPLVDPATGYPVPELASVTVVTPNGADAEAFASAILTGGEGMIRGLCRARARTGVLYVALTETGQPAVRQEGWVWGRVTK